MRNTSLLIVFVLAMLGLSPYVYAHSPMANSEAGNLAKLVDQSNLVFIGKVKKIEYRNARGGKGEGIIPYTIVTYSVAEVLRGRAPGKEITMRIVGGADGRGHFLTATGIPIFQAGDQDILFVGDTADPTCPLVNCEHGRFRILKERVYNTYGSPVSEIRESTVVARGDAPEEFRVVRFPAPKFDDLMRNPEVERQLKAQRMSIDVARKRYEAEAPKFIELVNELSKKRTDMQEGQSAENDTEAETFTALPLSKFVAVTKRLVAVSKRKPSAVKSIDPKAEIIVAKLKLTVPQMELQKPDLTTLRVDDEVKAYERNGFNPVIPE